MPLYPVFANQIWTVQASQKMVEAIWGKCPILIDSGASFTVVEKSWLDTWGPEWRKKITRIRRKFRPGDGKGCASIGMVILQLLIAADRA